MDKTLRELVDELPTQSLELFVQRYEAGEVGGFDDWGGPLGPVPDEYCRRCPRAALGFDNYYRMGGKRFTDLSKDHSAFQLEYRAMQETLDTAALYDECVWAIAERDATDTRAAGVGTGSRREAPVVHTD